MKVKVLFLIALLLPISVFSYEISFNKRFTKLVTPDVLSTYVNINIENESEDFINKHIEKFNKYIKGNKTVQKKDGKFTLSPKYKYFKNTQKFMGYIGTLRYVIKSENAKDLNKFIDDLINLENTFDRDNVKLMISSVSWNTSIELYDNSLDELRIDAIKWIDTYAQSLKNSLSKDCVVRNITINESNHQFLRAVNKESYSSKSVADIAPVNSSQEIHIEPKYLLECK